jgi:hypothetical protein
MTHEEYIRRLILWNRFGCYLSAVCALLNALIGSWLWVVCFGLAVFNGWMADYLEKNLNEL